MAIDRSKLTCMNCLYCNKANKICNNTKESIVGVQNICSNFHPDGICCRYCQFFGKNEVGENESVPIKPIGYFTEGYCQRCGFNFEKKWYQCCESFKRNITESVFEKSPNEVNSVRKDGTLKAELSDFPEIESKYTKNNSSGCYIATAVYGSYDCPEVWTLRRFRDFTLKSHSLGRLFIKVYYSISPKLVAQFGETKAFNLFWKKRLDLMVAKLQEHGVSSDPYEDE